MELTSFKGANLTGQIFGEATASQDIPIGILGLGPQVNSLESEYPYVIDNLVLQKFIKSRAFSLDLRSIDSPDGQSSSTPSKMHWKAKYPSGF